MFSVQMKKILLTFLFLICQNVFCQEYTFDKIFEYIGKSSYSKDKIIIDIFINSKNSNYTLVFQNYSGVTYRFIYDNSLHHIHYLTFEKINNTTEFKYLSSVKFDPDLYDSYCSKTDTQIEKKEDGICKVTQSRYYKKKVITKTELLCKFYEGADVTLSAKFFHNHMFCPSSVIPKNYVPTHIKKINDGNLFEFNLDKNIDTDLIIAIKKEAIKFKR